MPARRNLLTHTLISTLQGILDCTFWDMTAAAPVGTHKGHARARRWRLRERAPAHVAECALRVLLGELVLQVCPWPLAHAGG
jgi:hypothetical protein